MDFLHQPTWQTIEEELKQSMSKEIDLMREILSNMVAEENALLTQNKSFWESLLERRFHLIEEVKRPRENRFFLAKQLASLSDEKNFENFLCTKVETSCEIPFLLDQLIALFQKINTQQIRNQSLLDNPHYCIAIASRMSYLPPIQGFSSGKDRKQFLTTIP